MCGDTSMEENVKLTVTDYGAMNAGTSYYFRFPLVKNPPNVDHPLTYKLKLLRWNSNTFYPTIMGEYTMENYQQVVTGNSYTKSLTLSDSGDSVQSTLSLNMNYGNNWYPGNGDEILVKFENDNIKALTSLSSLTNLAQSNYAYEYYPNINLCVFKKNTGTSDSSISLGSFPTATQVQSYKVSFITGYPDSTNVYTGSYTSTHTLSQRTSLSASSFTKVSGALYSNSIGVYRISFTTPVNLPHGSALTITIDSQLIITEDYCKELSGFNVRDGEALICQKHSTTSYIINGYETISAGTALSLTVYLRIYNSIYDVSNLNARIVCEDWN